MNPDPTTTTATTPTPVKIIQIAVHPDGLIYGLGDDGVLYYWNTKMNEWTQVSQ